VGFTPQQIKQAQQTEGFTPQQIKQAQQDWQAPNRALTDRFTISELAIVVAHNEPVVAHEPVAAHVPVIAHEPVAAHVPVFAHEPVVAHEAVAAHVPVIAHEPVVALEPKSMPNMPNILGLSCPPFGDLPNSASKMKPM
jgi:hypothetical protein